MFIYRLYGHSHFFVYLVKNFGPILKSNFFIWHLYTMNNIKTRKVIKCRKNTIVTHTQGTYKYILPAKAPDTPKQTTTSDQTPADSSPCPSPHSLCHAIDKIILAARCCAPGSMAHLSLFKPHVPPFVAGAKSSCSNAHV